jgi:hypothetical protein
MTRSSTARIFAGWLLLSALVIGIQAPPAGEPGLYYDEAFLAQQGRDFLEPNRLTRHPPGTSSTYIDGRRFPLRNSSYLGSLKSQLLIPPFALFGASVKTLRLATLGTALVALLFTMLWAERILGTSQALIAGALVAFDPSFIFFGTCEWGPYTTMLLCRSLGLYGLTVGWQNQRTWLLVLGGLALGLGVYARADFVLIGIAAGVGLAAARGRTLLAEIRTRPRAAAAAITAAIVGATPMLIGAQDLLAVQAAIADRGDLAYRLQVLWSTLDGSHFYRVMQTGGIFERIFDAPAPASLFGLATAVAIGAGAGAMLRRVDPPNVFLLVTVAVLGTTMLLLPSAVRAHHMLNLLPFTQLLVTAVGAQLAGSRSARIAIGLALAGVLASEAHVTWRTREEIAATGGRGRWSNSLNDFAGEIGLDPAAVAISLDWGFHEPLLFLTNKQGLIEPIWTIPQLLRRGRPWVHSGDANHHYLVRDAPYDLFQLGPKLLAAARKTDSALTEIRAHTDRQGDPAFYSVRFTRPHQLVYSGEFEIRFQADRPSSKLR